MSTTVDPVVYMSNTKSLSGCPIDGKPYTYTNPKHYATQEDYDKVIHTERDRADLIIVAGKVVKDRFTHENVGKYHTEMLISAQSKARLDVLMKTCETDNPADIIANALQLFEHMVELSEQGYTFKKVLDGKEEDLKIFG